MLQLVVVLTALIASAVGFHLDVAWLITDDHELRRLTHNSNHRSGAQGESCDCECCINGECREMEACASSAIFVVLLAVGVVLLIAGIQIYQKYIKPRRAASSAGTPGMPGAQAQAQPMPVAA